ncbi:MAG: HAD-IC family P-type ATPase [Lachnospiraceae bacterium]|nr:HAD-IC family P-type ATPase [Lachnospiraceae bacterium]
MMKKGLSKQQVEERRLQGLVNQKCDIASKTYKEIFREHIFTYFNFLNLGLAICVALVHSYRNMLFMGVVFWNALIGIVQSIRAKKVLDKMNLLLESKAKVWRDGELVNISTWDIVKDDVLELEGGEQVCVDVEILSGTCEVNESMVTGESDSVEKVQGEQILSGSHLTSGKILCKVIAVGADNFANRIVKQARAHKNTKSEIKDSINRIIKVISVIVLPLGTIMFLKQRFMLDLSMKYAIVKTTASVISMIPDGLVLLCSGVMALSVIKLAKEKAVVQELFSIENLARVDVLCLDKTGTITEGRMDLEDTVFIESQNEVVEALECYLGVATEENGTMQAITDKYERNCIWQSGKVISFSSKRKWGMIEFLNKGFFILGAPEVVLKDRFKEYEQQLECYYEQGRRVLVFGVTNIAPNSEEGLIAVRPLAFFVLKDRIRENAEEILEYFQKQGVELKLISGDNVETVKQIAKRVGLKNADFAVDAREFKTKEELEEAVDKYVVFGRTTPEQKRGLVKALQRQGHVVGMTGDGVNDVLALKEADCSIVMDTGCDVARKTAKVVLLDSDFSVMPKVLAEGRRTINNLERSATLFLTKTIFASLLLGIFLFLNRSYPLQPIQFTLINGLTIGIPAFLLALEGNYERVKGRFFKKVCRTSLPAGLLATFNMGITTIICQILGYSDSVLSTLSVVVVVTANFLLLFHICRPYNKKRLGMLIGLLLIFIFALNFGSNIFLFEKLGLEHMIIIGVIIGIDVLMYKIFDIIKRGNDYRKG